MVEAETIKLPGENTGEFLHPKKGKDLGSKSQKVGGSDKSSLGKIKNVSSGKDNCVKRNPCTVSWEET